MIWVSKSFRPYHVPILCSRNFGCGRIARILSIMVDGQEMRFKQRAVVEFLFHEGIPANEIHIRLQNVYKEQVA
ncbi:hypothetical protein Y032_0124g1190 [Ancylostoma ceylanicum]|nr:hypothetical protein Y032_0124g1190 [Ancylostoma ceylanicum]